VKLISLDQIQPENVHWLWPGRVPLGKITILQGDPGLGKSTIALDLASRITTNGKMPDETSTDLGEPADVLLLSAEDDVADTIRPRLDALGAEQTRITIPADYRHFLVPSDASLLLEAIQQRSAKLCVIDPLTAFLDTTINSWNNQHVRRALTPLAEIASQARAAILIVDHLNKRSGIPAIHRGSGSVGFCAAARSVLLACKHPQEPETFVLSSVKNNLSAPSPSLSYRTLQAENKAVKLEWLGECPYDAEELTAAAFEPVGSRKLETAKNFLLVRLGMGAALSRVVEKEAAEKGISPRTLTRARKDLGVMSQPCGLQGEWAISLPVKASLSPR
jgi:archaellum biogenesis ATPase FlaH